MLSILLAAFIILPLLYAAPSPPSPLVLSLEQRSNQLPICIPPDITGQIPPSAVTTKQTGTDCTKYGDPPAQVLNDITSPDGLQDLATLCNGQIVNITDNLGEARKACLYINPASTKAKPLPLIVWLHPSLVSASLSWPLTGWDAVKTTQSLNNEDPTALGFSYILPFGRNTVHQYPIPDNVGLGWDNWYRNIDRTSNGLNADVDFIDKSIALAKKSVPVDTRRVFMSGWSNGASMALFYSLNTNGIASTSVYSAPDPYRDAQDPCTQVPYPLYKTPTQDVHNYCDLIGICTTGQYFYTNLKKRFPTLLQSFVVIDVITTAVKSRDTSAQCDPLCRGACALTEGTVAHLRFPTARNTDTFFAFFNSNPLPTSGTWGKL